MTGVVTVEFIKVENNKEVVVHVEDYEPIDMITNARLHSHIYEFIVSGGIGDKVVITVEAPD